MGWSCTAIASFAEKAMAERIGCNIDGASNTWNRHGFEYMYEIGREHDDGRITAQVYKLLETRPNGARTCKRAGSVLISAQGKIVHWPSSTAAERRLAQAKAFDDMQSTYSWQDACRSIGVPEDSMFIIA